jgi:TatD DNase family protein
VIDSHTHLDSCGPPNADLVAAADAVGVTRILTVGTDGGSCRSALAAAEDFPQVYAAIGRHPNSAEGFDEADLAELEALAAHERCLAIGESGLDYYRDYAPRADQERAFAAQIDLARALGKPLVIHTRAAEDDTLRILRERADGVQVIMHCFSMPDRLEECLAEGWWISFAGNVTYPNAQDLATAAERVPEDRLLVETDAPYLAPVPHRGRRNEPAWVRVVADTVAAVRGEPFATVAAATAENARRLFRLDAVST